MWWQVAGQVVSGLLSASASIAAGKEARKQKEIEAKQLEQERKQTKINTMQQHNDLQAELDRIEDINTATFDFMNRDDDNSRMKFKEAQKDITNRDLRRVQYQGLYTQARLETRRLSALRAGKFAERAGYVNGYATMFNTIGNLGKTGTGSGWSK